MSAPIQRPAARVLLVDDAGRVLLLHGGDPSSPQRGTWWFTPGGGREGRESPAQAAVRELAEETGLGVDAGALGEVVHERTTRFTFDGRDYAQHEHYFLLQVPAHEIDVDRPGAVVDPGVTGHRWWSRVALRETRETVFPPELNDLLDRLLGPVLVVEP